MAGEKTSPGLAPSSSLDQQVGSSAPCPLASEVPWTRHSISVTPCQEKTPGPPPVQTHCSVRKASYNPSQDSPEYYIKVDVEDEATTPPRSQRRGASLKGQKLPGGQGRQRTDSASDSEDGAVTVSRVGGSPGAQVRRHSFRVPRPSSGYEAGQPQQWTSKRPPSGQQHQPPSRHQAWAEMLHVTSDRSVNKNR